MISISVEDKDGTVQVHEVPTEVSLNLMEVLKAYDYNIAGTCGGMAICGTCHILVTNGLETLPPPADQEVEQLDSLPNPKCNSRLACQIHINNNIDGLGIKLLG